MDQKWTFIIVGLLSIWVVTKIGMLLAVDIALEEAESLGYVQGIQVGYQMGREETQLQLKEGLPDLAQCLLEKPAQ